MADDAGPDPVDVFVGARLRLFRHDAGMSQNELASHLGLSFQQVQKYEKGANRLSASMLAKASQALGRPVTEFFPTDLSEPGAEMPLVTPGSLELTALFAAMSREQRAILMSVARQFVRSGALEDA